MNQKIDLSFYDYYLPKELIAYFPNKKREDSRMMLLKKSSKEINEAKFSDITKLLNSGDLIVRNISKVIPARIYGRREETSGKVEMLLLDLPSKKDSVKVLLRTRGRLKNGERIILDQGRIAEYLGKEDGFHKVKFLFAHLNEFLDKHGKIPLPPYIKRVPCDLDKERYQTIYAKDPGSVAAPTAGFHFSADIIKALKKKNIDFVDLSLSVSYSTFKPLSDYELESGKLHKEYFKLPEKTARKINRAKSEGRRIIAVGTTTLRVLESQAIENEKLKIKNNLRIKLAEYRVKAGKGETDLFIYPPYKFEIANALITNFHLPKSSLFLLVSAFAGRDFLISAYNEAVRRKFRFFSYGDCMFIT